MKSRDLLEFLGTDAGAFDFDEYLRDERDMLVPALEARGFREVRFYTAEGDSFGPLIRGCVARSSDGALVRFFYG